MINELLNATDCYSPRISRSDAFVSVTWVRSTPAQKNAIADRCGVDASLLNVDRHGHVYLDVPVELA